MSGRQRVVSGRRPGWLLFGTLTVAAFTLSAVMLSERAGSTFAKELGNGPAPGAQAQVAQTADLEGWLSVVWQDPQDISTGEAPPPLFFLETDSGDHIRLVIPDSVGFVPELPLEPIRVAVGVAGAYDPAGGAPATVLSIQELESPITPGGSPGGAAEVQIRYGFPALTTESLRFAFSPAPFAVSGQTLFPPVVVEAVAEDGWVNDADNSTVITLTLEGPVGGVLACGSGESLVTAGGTAAFDDCSITGPDGDYTIIASAGGIDPIETSPISVGDGLDCQLGQCVFDFDSDDEGFFAFGLWHRETLAAPTVMSSVASMAFNEGCIGAGMNGCEYNTGGPHSGFLASPPLEIGEARMLSFRMALGSIQCPNDLLQILYSTDNLETAFPVPFATYFPDDRSVMRPGFTYNGAQLGWFYPSGEGIFCGNSNSPATFRTVLPAGTTNVVFAFEADGVGDSGGGWFVDDIRFDPVPDATHVQVHHNWALYPAEYAVGQVFPDIEQPYATLQLADGMLVADDSATSVTLQLLQDGGASPPAAGLSAPQPAQSHSLSEDVASPNGEGTYSPGPGPLSDGDVVYSAGQDPSISVLPVPGATSQAVPPGAFECAGGLTQPAEEGVVLYAGCHVTVASEMLQIRSTASPSAVPSIGRLFSAVEPVACEPDGCSFDFETPMWPSRQSFWHRESFAGINGTDGTTLAFNQGCVGPGGAGCTFAGAQEGWAYSPLIETTGPSTLRFKVARDVGPSSVCHADDWLEILYTTDGETYFTADVGSNGSITAGGIYLEGWDICGNSLTAQTVALELPEGVQRVVFAFWPGSPAEDDYAGIFIDDVQIFEQGHHLQFQQAPASGTFTNHTFPDQPVVAVTNGFGEVDTGDNVTVVTLASAGHSGALVCHSGQSRIAVAGIATFDGCYSTVAGEGLTLLATAATASDATSAPFAVLGVLDHQMSGISVGSEVMLCGRNSASQLWCRETIGGAWGPWTLLLESGAAGRPIMVTLGGDIFVFYRGAADDLRYTRRSGGIWTDNSLGGGIAGDPVVAVDGDGDIMAVVLNSVGAMYYNVFLAGAWSGYQATDGLLSGRLEMVEYQGDLQLFGLNGDGPIWNREWDSGTNTWGPWASLGGAVAGIPTAAVHGGDLYMLVYSLTGEVWYRVLDSGAWGDWQPLGGSLAGRPELAAGSGQLLLGSVNPSGAAWSLARNGSWGSWTALGGLLRTSLELAPASAGIYAFGLGIEGGLWYRLWDGGAWGPWTGLGGVLHMEQP